MSVVCILLVGCSREPLQGSLEASSSQPGVSRPPPESGFWGPQPHVPAGDHRFVEAELRREVGPFLQASTSDDPLVVERAMWGLARLGRLETLSTMRGELDGDVSSYAIEALAAFGLLDPPPGEPQGIWRALEDALWEIYAVTQRSDVARSLLFSLARIGGARSVERLGLDLADAHGFDRDGRSHVGFAALTILCSRGYGLEQVSRDAIALGLTSSSTVVQGEAARALARCVAPSAELLAGPERTVLVERLTSLVSGGSEDTNKHAWRALASLGELPSEVAPEILGESPPMWEVELEAVRALSGHPRGRVLLAERLTAFDSAALGHAFGGPRIHVLLEAYRGGRKLAVERPSLASELGSAFDHLVGPCRAAEHELGDDVSGRCFAAHELLAVLAIAKRDAAALDRNAVVPRWMPAHYLESLRVDVLLALSNAREPLAKKRLLQRARALDVDSAVALSALTELDDVEVGQTLRAALSTRDVGLVAAAAGAIAARAMDVKKRDVELVEELERVLSEWSNDDAIEVRLLAIEALGNLARTVGESTHSPTETQVLRPVSRPGAVAPAPWLERTILPLARDPHVAIRRAVERALAGHGDLLARYDALASEAHLAVVPEPLAHAWVRAREHPPDGLRIHTRLGVLEIAFEHAPAPINQANLAALADAGFFDGLTFHRVVPGFVVQGGDPRGDGYGGPGHVVPCEWSNLHYDRGTVGVALAGKDTGGSQIFVTQSDQVHLDGRYTVVGNVRTGMDVVDRLLPGDRMTRVEVIHDE